MVRLARRKNYRLVGTNRFGFNLIFVRNDLSAQLAPEVQLSDLLHHVRVADEAKKFDAVSGLPFVTPDP